MNIYAFVCACVYPFSPPLRSFMIVFFFFVRASPHTQQRRTHSLPSGGRTHEKPRINRYDWGGDDYDDDIIDRFLATVCPIVAFRRRGSRAYGAYVCTGFFFL